MTLIALIEGPFWQGASLFFLIFAGWRLFAIMTTGGPRLTPRPSGSAVGGAALSLVSRFVPRRMFWKSGRTWFVTLAGYAFHLGLFAVLFFAAPHVAFLKDRILGFGWQPLPRTGFIIAAEFAFAGLIALWVRRFVDPVVRLISRRDDHIAAGLTFVVMFSGCTALGLQSVFLRGAHLLSVEIWLVYFPFSSLMHTFTWPLTRIATGALAGRRGTRF